ncbi:MAG TPA: nucleotidyltransferase family protein [Pyrinomonadaceae bacterium]|nr:nucleotidyltransferase family protein [Pyrinomonadaceae bacterium]
MILAAGYGTRLWPLTIDRAKPAIPFMGRPLVGYVAEYLARFGCREVAVNLHHRPESVRAALGDGGRFGVRLEYVEEPEILGTSGALDNARYFFERDTFVVVNGKIATDIDLGAAFETHRRAGALATLVLQRNEARERFSAVEVEGGLVTRFAGMPSKAGTGDAPLMFTGIQILEPRVFDYIPRGVFSHTTTDVYVPAIARGERVAAHVAEGYWYELSTIPRYLDISLALMKREGVETVVGEGAVIEPGADVTEAVLWENARVGRGARVRRAVLGAGVSVGAGEIIEDAAVVRAELVEGEERPEKALPGEVRGANFVVPLGG